MKKADSILLLIVAVVVISAYQSGISSKTTFIVPDLASLRLEPVYASLGPFLVLTAGIASGCDSISPLQVNKAYSTEKLRVDIVGHNFTDAGGFQMCTADVRSSQAHIPIDVDWLQKGEKDVVFILSGKENIYKLSFNNYKIKLIPYDVINVVSKESTYSQNNTPLTQEIKYYPSDVALLSVFKLRSRAPSELRQDPVYDYVIGDYRPALRDFAKVMDLIPAENVYAGFPQSEENDTLFVVVKNLSQADLAKLEGYGMDLPNQLGVIVRISQ